MTINPITYPPVSESSRLKSRAATTDETQKLKQKEGDEAQEPQSGAIPDHKRFDTYEKSDGERLTSESGIYRLSEDENGGPKILFDTPEEMNRGSEKPSGAEDHLAGDMASQKASGGDAPKEKPETIQCTTNTDRVDAEIEKLKEEREQILQQLGKAGGDAEKQADLEKRLSQLDAELQAKDNDAYRKQHATHTTENAE